MLIRMNDDLLNEPFKYTLRHTLLGIFPNLIMRDFDFIYDILCEFIEIMIYKFGFDNTNVSSFLTLLTQNDNQCIKSITKLLLPYIDDIENFKLFAEIESLEDITTKVKSGIDRQSDPTKDPYLISTFQYSAYHNIDGVITEHIYSIGDVTINYQLLLHTLELSRSKMHVNWLDILPITRLNYKESRLYKKSFDIDDGKLMVNGRRLRQFKGSEDNEMDIYGGISTHDMFNAVHVFLFNEIYMSGAKWLMYEKQMKRYEKPITYLEILNTIVNIKYLDYSFTTLSRKKIEEITNNWHNLKTKSELVYKNFIKCVMFKFDLKFCTSEMEEDFDYNSTEFYKPYMTVKVDLDDEDAFLDPDKIEINDADYIRKVDDFFAKIPFEIIFDFFNDQIVKFKRTWYGKNMLNDKNNEIVITTIIDINSDLETQIEGNTNTYYLTYKNIYNYAKYISIHVTSINKGNVTDSRCLNNDMWEIFFQILNDEYGGGNRGFNISRVINKTYGDDSRSDHRMYQNFIKDNFMKTFKDNVFIIYISLGLLTELVPNPHLTDESLLGDSDEKRKKNIISRVKNEYVVNKTKGDMYLDTEYYLTRDKYRDLILYKGRDDKNDDTRINWFQHMTMGEPWYNYFAFSPISQLNFNHHFLNNRVIMVTGTTGQGKSVVVPILFYYASIALNLNSKSKVLSTQALVGATIGNASFMALNMGVPININGMKTLNSYVQYSTQGDKHLVQNSESYIKEVTDRTLLEELINNPLMKRVKDSKSKKKKNQYLDDNVYDVIIIDEAHMHNSSMDTILTIIKNTIMINNQIKLVITSATMDADEFIYRRYYKYIDDNYIFPLTVLPDREQQEDPDKSNRALDRNTVDRRFHISPPGKTSRYTVTDIFLENDTSSYEEAEREGIRTVKRVLPISTGDMLFFTTTTPLVLSITRELNKDTPNDVIALPLYSKLRELKKDIDWFALISNIDKTKPNIIYSKDDIIDVIETGTEGFATIPPNRYKRVIIVATNVVEASITIKTLETVIDTGYFNSVVFDNAENKNVQCIDKISEASRMQRRGRVGRAISGTVYYMYAKGARAHIKPEYELVTKDIAFDIFKLASSHSDELLLDMNKHPQNFKFDNNYDEYAKFILSEENEDIRKIYRKQYSCVFTDVEKNMIHPFIVPEITSVIEDLDTMFPLMYKDGYGQYSLFDNNGDFYIIHPGEKFILRDVLTGKIIAHNKSHPHIFKDDYLDKIYFAFDKMQYLKFLYYDGGVDIKDPKDNVRVHKNPYYDLINDGVREGSDSIEVITKNHTEEEIIKIFKTMFMSNIYSCSDSVIKILALLYSIGDYKSFIRKHDKNPKRLLYDEFIKKWKNNTSELLAYLNIMNVFIHDIDVDGKTNVKFTKESIDTRFEMYEKLYEEKGMSIFANLDNINHSELSKREINIFTESKNRHYTSEKRLEKFTEMAQDVVIENTSLEMLCKSNYVQVTIIENAIKLYKKLKKIYNMDKIQKIMITFKDIYPSLSPVNDPIIMSFLENYGFNIIKYKNKRMYNILTNNDLIVPKFPLTSVFNSYYFFILLTSGELLGLTIITPDIIKKVFAMNSYRKTYIHRETKLVNTPKIEYITGKSNIVNSKNNEYDMNNIIITDLNKIKQY